MSHVLKFGWRSLIAFGSSLFNMCVSVGVFIARGKEDALATLNLVPGESVYGEKKIVIDVSLRTMKET